MITTERVQAVKDQKEREKQDEVAQVREHHEGLVRLAEAAREEYLQLYMKVRLSGLRFSLDINGNC